MVLGLPLEKIDLRDVCYWACSYPVQYWLEAWVMLRTTCSTAELCSCMQVLKARWAAWWDRMWAQGTECCLVLVLLQYYHLLTKNLFTEVWELKRGFYIDSLYWKALEDGSLPSLAFPAWNYFQENVCVFERELSEGCCAIDKISVCFLVSRWVSFRLS